MSQHVDITEVSDPRDLTIDDQGSAPTPQIRILRGQPSDAEIAALVAVLSSAGGGAEDAGPQELNRWGLPVDGLRYSVFSWQTVTLVERTHMRR